MTAATRAAGTIGEEVFVEKRVGGISDRIEPTTRKSRANKFKKYAAMAGINEPKKSCHGVRKTRAEAAAYADCTEAQMMAMFGWTDPKMPAHYIAKARRAQSALFRSNCLSLLLSSSVRSFCCSCVNAPFPRSLNELFGS